MNYLAKNTSKSLSFISKYGYHFPNPTSIVHHRVILIYNSAWINC